MGIFRRAHHELGPVSQKNKSHKSKRHSKDHKKKKSTSKPQIFGTNRSADGEIGLSSDDELINVSDSDDEELQNIIKEVENEDEGYKNDNLISLRIDKIKLEKEDREGRTKRVKQKVAKLKLEENLAHYRSVSVDDVYLRRLQFGCEKTLITVVESNDCIEVTSPWFGAVALVSIPALEEGVSIQVGWIQTCHDITHMNTYGNEGIQSWEIPELTNKDVGWKLDGTGEMYPWYDVDKMTFMQGPTRKERAIKVDLAKQLKMKTPWDMVVPHYASSPRLTFMYLNQEFFAYLVFRDLGSKRYEVLKKISWSTEMAVAIDTTKAVGKRAEVLGPCVQKTCAVVDKPLEPFLNDEKTIIKNSLISVWRPKYADPLILVKATRDAVNFEEYFRKTRELGTSFYRNNRRNFLLKQKGDGDRFRDSEDF